MTPGDVLRELREERGLTQQQLADDAGLDRSWVNGIERGKRGVGKKTAAKLADALGVDATLFLSPNPVPSDRLKRLEAEVEHLAKTLETVGESHDRLRARVEELERRGEDRAAEARQVELATRAVPIRRGKAAR